MRHWIKVGVELEGGWNKHYGDVANTVRGAQAHDDASVHGTTAPYHGEIVTKPSESLDSILLDINALWPDAVNKTCGMHVHLSFSAMDMSILADSAFWKHYRARWWSWGEQHRGEDLGTFWERWHGHSTARRRPERGADPSFCKAAFKPAEQLKLQRDRYTQLNFCAWLKYRTLESRLLPMFPGPKGLGIAQNALVETVDIFETYLNAASFPEVSEDFDLVLVNDVALETYTELLPSRAPLVEIHPPIPLTVRRGDFYSFLGVDPRLLLPFAPATVRDDTGAEITDDDEE